MDALSITVSVVSLVTTSARVATYCNSLIGKYKNAPQILSSVRTEVAATKAALSYVYMLMNRDSPVTNWSEGPLAESLDVALTGCTITFSLLDVELQKLYNASNADGCYSWNNKLRFMWDEGTMRSLLDQMRGIRDAVNLVLTALQTDTLTALVHMLSQQRPVIDTVRRSIKSVFEARESGATCEDNTPWRRRNSNSDETYSIFSSTLGDETFAFDDEVVDSAAYRRVLGALRQSKASSKASKATVQPTKAPELVESRNDLSSSPEVKAAPQTGPVFLLEAEKTVESRPVSSRSSEEIDGKSDYTAFIPTLLEVPKLVLSLEEDLSFSNMDFGELFAQYSTSLSMAEFMKVPEVRNGVKASVFERFEAQSDAIREISSEQAQGSHEPLHGSEGSNTPSIISIEAFSDESCHLKSSSPKTPTHEVIMSTVVKDEAFPASVSKLKPALILDDAPERSELESTHERPKSEPLSERQGSLAKQSFDVVELGETKSLDANPEKLPKRLALEIFIPKHTLPVNFKSAMIASQLEPSAALALSLTNGPSRKIKITLVGDSCTGKSRHIWSLLGKEGYVKQTIFDYYSLSAFPSGSSPDNCPGIEIMLADTPGVDDYDRLRPLSYPDTDVVLFFCRSICSLDNIGEKWLPELNWFLPKAAKILVGTDSERRGAADDQVSTAQASIAATKYGMSAYMETSIKSPESIQAMFRTAVELAVCRKFDAGPSQKRKSSRWKWGISK